MALAYTPPGVTVNEIVSPQISPLLAAPALICLVGPVQGYQERTDTFFLKDADPTAPEPIALPGLPANSTVSAVVSVKDALYPDKGVNGDGVYVEYSADPESPANEDWDYTVDLVNGTITREATAPTSVGTIPNNTLVNVTYRYVPENYYSPYRLYDLGSVESRYGSALNDDKTGIGSYLSYAAAIAFENGADSVVCQPLFVRTTPNDPTTPPIHGDSSNWADVDTWNDTLWVLRDIEDINVIVPVIGESMDGMGEAPSTTVSNIAMTIQGHLDFMRKQNQYIISIIGGDSSSDVSLATQSDLWTLANLLRTSRGGALAEQQVIINTSRFTRPLPGPGGSISVGGQYVAAAVAGMLTNRPTSFTLTRKIVSGFIGTTDIRDLSQKNEDAENGLMVIEQRGRNLIIRHSITIDKSDVAKKELSVVRAKHRVIESVKDTLDRQIIGNIVADENALGIVTGAVASTLEALRGQKDIVSYSGLQARFTSLDPTTIQVRFSYRPAFPVNYIDVQFSLDLSSGQIQSTIPLTNV